MANHGKQLPEASTVFEAISHFLGIALPPTFILIDLSGTFCTAANSICFIDNPQWTHNKCRDSSKNSEIILLLPK